MSIVGSNALAGASGQAGAGAAGFKIDRSLRFNDDDSATLSRTPSSAGNRRTWSWSGWVKRTTFGTEGGIFSTYAGAHPNTSLFWESDGLKFHDYTSDYQFRLGTTAKYRDPSAWYHIVLAYDSTESTASDRAKLWINGVLQTLSGTTVPSNHQTDWNSATQHDIGRFAAYFDGYMAEVHFVDGQALAPTDFGEYDDNNVWQPKEYTHSTPKWVGDWVSDTTGTPYSGGTKAVNAFDGNSSTQAAANANGSMVFTPSSPITGITKVRIRGQYDSGTSADILLNGSSIKSSWSDGENAKKEFTVNNLTSLEWQTDGGNLWMSVRSIEIEVDGVYHYLLIGGVNDFTLNFSDNSSNAALGTDSSGNSNTWTVNNLQAAGSAWNQSQTWSDNITGGSGAYGAAANAFDGSLSTFASPEYSSPMTYTNPSASDTVISTFEIYGRQYSSSITLELNDTSISSQITTSVQWHTITGFSGDNFEKLYWRPTSGNSEIRIYAIRVNGQILVDDDIADPEGKNIDSLIDTPTNYTAGSGNNGGNYCTWNPLNTSSDLGLTNGNLGTTGFSSNSDSGGYGTFGVSSGKWYYEATPTTINQQPYYLIGWGRGNARDSNGSDEYLYYSQAALRGASSSSYGASWTAGDVIGVALDLDAGTLVFYKNGVSQGTAFTGITGTVVPKFRYWHGHGNFNFGQRPFAYTPPTGYLSLCTQNLADPTIADGSTAMDVDTYQGTGSTHERSNFSFSPDFLWVKAKGGTASPGTQNHYLVDTVRGASGSVTKKLFSNTTGEENAGQTDANNGIDLQSDGFELTTGNDGTNNANNTYVAWAWDAGTSNTSISAGGLNSSVYDQSQTWSNSLSASFRSGEPATNAFDGDTSTIAGSGGSITYTSPVAVASSSTIRVFVHGGDHDVSVNSGANQTVPAGSFVTLNFTNPTNSTFTITFDRVGSADTGVRAIEIGGKLLVDNGVTVTNVPSIASTVRANPSAGFSIVSWTASGTNNDSVGHGLNAKPEFFILKSRDGARNWLAYTEQIDGSLDVFYLNSTVAKSNSSATAPTSSVFYVYGSNANTSGEDMIAYCFAPVEGYSAFGSYEGNGNTDGPFVFCGFKPRWIMYKNADATEGWGITDTARSVDNPADEKLEPNTSSAEATVTNRIDVLSNGFKIRAGSAQSPNESGNTYIYAAFSDKAFSLNGGLAR